jgi:hypothetical protein
MATQTRLLPEKFQLDTRSREAGRRGLVKARAALAEATARARAERRSELGDDHATAA